MRLKAINRTSLFINHSSTIRSVDHISLPPQIGLGSTVSPYRVKAPWCTLALGRHEFENLSETND